MGGPFGLSTEINRSIKLAGALLGFVLLAVTSGAPVAAASSAPIVHTGEVGQVTTSSATLQGSLYAGNEATSYYFQYGATSAFGAQTPLTLAGGGMQTYHASAVVTGLSPYTTYYWRLVAVNASGTVDGAARTFTTKKVPLTFQVEATPDRDVFGSPFSVRGTLTGTGSANHAIVLQANPFPYLAGYKAITGPALTDVNGSFSFTVPGLVKNAQLRVATLETPAVYSHVLVELVPVRVTLELRSTGRPGYARLFGTVTPAEPGSVVGFQLLRPGRRPLGVASMFITGRAGAFSRFSRVVRIRRAGFYRAVVYVASGAQVSNHSRDVLIH